MTAATGAIWHAQANNQYYRISELVLPPLVSTGLQRFEVKTTLLPHTAGRILIKSQGLERATEITASSVIELESGTDCEIVNTTDQELRLTVLAFK